MRSTGLLGFGVVALLVACLPTEPCACPPLRTWFLVFGSVVRSDGMPVPAARIRVSAPFDAGVACDAPGFRESMDPEIVAGADGRFRSAVFSMMGSPGLRCIRVAAFAGTAGASDSTAVDGLIVQFHRGDPPDSLGIQLTIP